MEEVTLQIQSVIYQNKASDLKKAVTQAANAVRVAKEHGICISGSMVYGDASAQAVLTEEEVADIQGMLPKEFRFSYRVFGMNTGTAKGHNLLAQHCSAAYLLIMNPDILMSPSCLYELFRSIKQKDAAMAEARQTPLEHAKAYEEKTGETQWASTACVLIRTSVFRSVHGFDADTFFMYCDDVDFSWRVRLAGYKILYQPRAVVYHAKHLSIGAKWLPTCAERYYSAEAALLLSYKWSDFNRTRKLLKQYEACGGEDEKKAAAQFRKRQKEKRLPHPIDKNRKIGKFIGDEYGEMRFQISGH